MEDQYIQRELCKLSEADNNFKNFFDQVSGIESRRRSFQDIGASGTKVDPAGGITVNKVETSGSKKQLECYNCGQSGHIAPRCPKASKAQKSGNGGNRKSGNFNNQGSSQSYNQVGNNKQSHNQSGSGYNQQSHKQSGSQSYNGGRGAGKSGYGQQSHNRGSSNQQSNNQFVNGS